MGRGCVPTGEDFYGQVPFRNGSERPVPKRTVGGEGWPICQAGGWFSAVRH